MKQTLKNMRIRKWMGVLFAAVLMTALGAQTALASTDYVKSISITLDVAPVPGEDLPALHYGYTGDTGYEVKIPSNERYEIVSAEWGSKIDEAELGGTYTIKITLETLNDYRFSSSYSSSKVTVRGGDFVSAKRQGSGKLLVTVKTDPAEGSLDEPEEVYWSSGKYTSSKFGYADWEKVEGAAYDVYLYRGSKNVKKVTDLHTSSYNFYPYMTKEGDYSFKVRTVPHTEEEKKRGKKSEWTEAGDLYIAENEVSDGSGQENGDGSTPSGGNTDVGWRKEGDTWYFKYPDGNYQKNGWLRWNDKWYLFDETGRMVTGWKQTNSGWYYLGESGDMKTGWVKSNNIWYYMNPNQDGPEGAMVKNSWLTIDGKTYFMNESGAMVEGWYKVQDNWYYFYPGQGQKAVNTSISGFQLDANGVWQH